MIFACITWSCSMFNFYLITFYLKYFPGSIFKNSIYFAIADFTSFVVSGTILKKTNANKTLFISFVVAGIGALTYLFFYWNLALVPLFILCSRIGNSMAFNTLYISNNRLFPTRFLASTFGLVNFVSHLIAVGAPMVAEVPDPYPFGIFLTNAGIGAISSFFLKEMNTETRSKAAGLIGGH